MSSSSASSSDPSPELALIVSCVRRAFELSELIPLPAESGRPDFWERFEAKARRQGLAPLVYAAMVTAGVGVPPATAARLRAAYLGESVRATTGVEPALTRVVRALHANDVQPVVLKGAALAYTAYPQSVQRTFADLDLLLPERDLDLASRVVRELGFARRATEPVAQHHLPAYYSPSEQIGIELHRGLLPEPHPYALAVEDFFDRARVELIAGTKVHVLSSADALILACVHLAYAHRYGRFPLRGLTDILALSLRRDAGIDWQAFLATIQRSRTSGAVYWPLWLSQTLLGAPIPAEVLLAIVPPRLVQVSVSLAAQPHNLFEEAASSEEAVLQRILLDFSLYQGCSVGEQVRALLHGFFPPPHALGHLPARVRHSRVRYASSLLRPTRIVHGLKLSQRVVARVANEFRQHQREPKVNKKEVGQ